MATISNLVHSPENQQFAAPLVDKNGGVHSATYEALSLSHREKVEQVISILPAATFRQLKKILYTVGREIELRAEQPELIIDPVQLIGH